jgi:hypothetical protein
MAIWLMAVVRVAPCQCFSPGGHTTTSPARISCFGLPALHPTDPEVTTNRWPNGWVWQAVRAPVAGTVQFRPVRCVQYGHKLNLVTGKSGLFPSISSLETGNPADAERFLPMLDHHIAHYGGPRRQIAADGGYASRDNLDEPGEVVRGVSSSSSGQLGNLAGTEAGSD